mmetsp:Transcript_3087/g.8766  ORF Transcript_3087/g.8766 Transcript_3087/m.8766 type:complete len:536 (-) Transcript_3087:97-1704(-)|eukprot:CAMPEP_0118856328 /NCGR_PEP_ID=MMETSP1163-20130328/3842_1 /TAXON_ID=124430 /ORGANISM="Phaeomonas parva, Strain CCMP2877" /LENGTH=535 /DNA_ID=CAMNT_0006789409 /DNA_START=79 /DNA_END=1686 /DNA_ORIENTATION=-
MADADAKDTGPAAPEGASEAKTGGGTNMATAGAKMLGFGMAAYSAAEKATNQVAAVTANAASNVVEKNLTAEQKDAIASAGVAAEKQAKTAVLAATKQADKMMESAKEGAKMAEDMQKEAYDALDPELRAQYEANKRDLAMKVEKVKAKTLDLTGPMVDKVLDMAAFQIKQKFGKDADCPRPVVRAFGKVIDMALPDIKHEVQASLTNTIMTGDTEPEPEEEPTGIFCCCAKIRNFILYHQTPYDKTPWGAMRDPWHLALMLPPMIPVFGVRVLWCAFLLFLICAGWPADEYMIIQFIQKFKGFQFVTGGVVAAVLGGWQYYNCATYEYVTDSQFGKVDIDNPCIDDAPGAGAGFFLEIVEYSLNCLLVWIAFFVLPYTGKHGEKKFAYTKVDPTDKDPENGDLEDVDLDDEKKDYKPRRGGRLGGLLYYDLAVFVINGAVVVAICVSALDGDSLSDLTDDQQEEYWNFVGTTLYWCRVTYALLTFPFVLFSLPILKKILTHAYPTGFNRVGKAVPMKPTPREYVPPAKDEKGQD